MTETTTPTQHDADTFELDAWLEDAVAPERHVTIFKRGDLAGQISDIDEMLASTPEDDDNGEGRLTDESPRAELLERRNQIMGQMLDSGLTLVVRALSTDARDVLYRAHFPDSDKPVTDKATAAEKNRSFSHAMFAQAIVGRIAQDGTRHPISLTPAQVTALIDKIGTAQEGLLARAYNESMNQAPKVDADFLRERSQRTS